MNGHRCRGGRAPSSYWLHPDPEAVFLHLGVGPGMTLVDAGCGAGDYALHAAGLVGGAGRIVALEREQDTIRALFERVQGQGLTNVHGQVCDITGPLSLEDGAADVVLLATVLHIPAVRERCAPMFREFYRVLRSGGRLGVLDCKKEEASFGPPLHMRLSVEEVEALVLPHGFEFPSALDLGHTNLLCFRRA